jgi:hypothetical protein
MTADRTSATIQCEIILACFVEETPTKPGDQVRQQIRLLFVCSTGTQCIWLTRRWVHEESDIFIVFLEWISKCEKNFQWNRHGLDTELMKTQHLVENVRVAAGEKDGIGFERPSLTYHPFMWGRVQHWSAELDKNSRYHSQPQLTCFNSGATSTSARFVHVTLTQYDTQPKVHYHLYRTLLLLIWVLQIPPGQNFNEIKQVWRIRMQKQSWRTSVLAYQGT